jgi:putative endonuclease
MRSRAAGGEDRSVPDAPSAWVYLLRCRDGSLYCGWTNDLDRRLAAHSTGRGSRYTASRRPVELAAAWPMDDRSAALREEARIKRLTRRAKQELVAMATASAPAPARPAPAVSPPRSPRAPRRVASRRAPSP